MAGSIEESKIASTDVTTKSNAVIKRPSEKAFFAWRIRELLGITKQKDIAEEMTKLGLKASQGEVSRFLSQVKEYLRAGNHLPAIDLPSMNALSKKPQTIDPAEIDKGPRRDGRTQRQRDKYDPDSRRA